MRRKHAVTLILSAVIVVLVAAVGVLFWKYQQVKSPDDQAKRTSSRIIGAVSNLYMVPTGEEPTVAQIQDKDKLNNQDFFKTAENGDYLLVYQKAKVALVYREKVNKLVNVGPVNLDNQKNQDSANQQGQAAGAETNTPSH